MSGQTCSLCGGEMSLNDSYVMKLAPNLPQNQYDMKYERYVICEKCAMTLSHWICLAQWYVENKRKAGVGEDHR